MRKKDLRARLLGLGLDCDDGHTRVTRGENYHLLGGSEMSTQVVAPSWLCNKPVTSSPSPFTVLLGW